MADTNLLRTNAILAALPPREFDPLAEEAKVVELGIRAGVHGNGGAIQEVYFPIDSVFSTVATTSERVTVEVATTGREGMVGLPVFLGASSSPHASFCQIPGRSVQLGTEVLHRILADDGTLHRILNRFTQVTMVQIAQNVVCNAAHTTDQRTARWMLMTQDRVGRNEFLLTQEFLAQMLGVRRPTVSEVARRLQADGLIRYRRGTVVISDRSGLERAACLCYGVVRSEFDAMGPDS